MDPFESIIGNEHIKLYLKRMVQKKAIAHSLLFSGKKGLGKSLFAKAFAELLLTENDHDGSKKLKFSKGNNPDLIELYPEGKVGLHSIESIRQMVDQVYLPPLESEKKVFIIHEAERMLTYSSNALLKIFEEPTLHSVILLVSNEPSLLLPTVRSRCVTFPFQSIDIELLTKWLTEKNGIEQNQAKAIALRAKGAPGTALCQVKEEKNCLEKILLKILCGRPFISYSEGLYYIKQLIEQIELIKKDKEKEQRDRFTKAAQGAELTAAQRHYIEKEIEGTLSLCQKIEANAIFEKCLEWIRDLHLVLHGADRSLLYFVDYSELVEEAVQRGNLPTIELALEAVKDAKLSLERSTSLALCLENFLLRTSFLS